MTERQEEQAALHALHLLDAHEERILRSETRNDPKLASLAAELEEIAGQIALVMPQEPPPPEHRRALLAELRQRRRAKVTNFAKPLRILSSPWLAWAAAAVVTVVAWSFRAGSKRSQQEALALKADAASARNDADAARQKLIDTEKKLVEAKLNA